jgi:NAD-dependent SIR2 family protein deacetylase
VTSSKTVFVLGAGVSKADNLPMQSELLSQIFSLDPWHDENQSTFMQLKIDHREHQVLKHYAEFEKQRRVLADFVVENFTPQKKRAEYNAIMSQEIIQYQMQRDILRRAYTIASEVNVTLEDLFTLFDKIILGHEHFHIYSTGEIEDVHRALRKCIIFLLSYYCAIRENEIININKMFAKIIFDTRLAASRKEDILSIITMNWDTLFERELYRLCKENNSVPKNGKIYPDLCFYDDVFKNTDNRIVSTHVKAKGHRNIKLLKIHGSINWLMCPYCGRIYVDYDEDIALNEFTVDCLCPKCGRDKHFSQSPRMNSILITPTFLKDLNNLYLKNIWHNAFLDITEAKKIVFIGYSFPDADFEMRCLLKKAVQPGTAIEVVLHNADDPETYKTTMINHGFASNEVSVFINGLNLPEKRYKAFFGNEAIILYYCGIEEYLKQEMNI